MKIGLHDAEQEYFKGKKTFPNYALMKISAWHKARGDSVDGQLDFFGNEIGVDEDGQK